MINTTEPEHAPTPGSESPWIVGIRESWGARLDAKTGALVRAVVKESFRIRHGLSLDGQQDPVCDRHRWMESGSILECMECGDVDDHWVPGWCPSGGCLNDTHCNPEERPTGGCPWITRKHHPHPEGSYDEFLTEEEEEDERWLIDQEEDERYLLSYAGGRSGRVRASKRDLGRCCERGPRRRSRRDAVTPKTPRDPPPEPPAVPPTTLKGLRELGSTMGIKNASKMNSETLRGLLGIPHTEGRKPKKPVSIVLTDPETGEILKFPSISKTAGYLGVNPGSVSYHI